MKPGFSLFVVLLLSAGPIRAELVVPNTPLADPELDSLRGGFVMDNLEIAIGLEQVIAVNGESLVINRLTIPNLNQVGSLERFQSQMESVLAIQGASFDGLAISSSAMGSDGWMAIIQNSLNSTTIQNIRQLDIELNNLGGA